MAQLHNSITTIPRLFKYLAETVANETTKPLMKHKVEGKYIPISYDEFREQTENFAYGLASLGVKSSDKVAIISENRPEWVYSDMAILSLGAIDVPLYPSLTADSVEFIINNSESKGIIVSNKLQLTKFLKIRDNCKSIEFIVVLNEKDFNPEVKGLFTFQQIQELGKKFKKENPDLLKDSIEKVKPEDICTIIYTSGTTGEPKGVVLTHNNILSNVRAALEVFPIGKDDVFLSFLPLCHIFERMAGYYTAFSSGGTICYAESIETVAQNLLEIRPTIMTTVPRLFERIHSKIMKNVESQPEKKQKIFHWAIEVGKEYQKARKLKKVPFSLAAKHKIADKLVFKKLRERTGGRLRFFISGGAALSKDLGEFFEAVGILIIEGYGLTESSPVIAANRLDDYKFGTVGKPFPGVEVKIAPDGEILAKGPNIMQGYYKNPKETEATIKDGWLYTGDIGEFDSEGFLKITDRKKHLFKTSAGKYIAPTPIENLFLASKYIDQFVLIGDRRMFLTALIVPDFEALKEYADSNNIKYNDVADLIKDERINKFLENELNQMQRTLANYERVRKFALLDRPFSIETGEITPSLKIRRKYIEERYRDLIERMYESLEKKSE
ncbi:MAG: long-chain fatty acid--CoA ligase [Ignavibacterium sp.]|nr:long-chain fatty acid--CoA ligase [Ignavibacterium sp.]MCX7612322.1 long-chain fatty acid--CoA ligase [Ignavibacterium sp.]MDW8376325.1 long-chain fatty acid--CoA ligase [Ignavibacteriales bacterium]